MTFVGLDRAAAQQVGIAQRGVRAVAAGQGGGVDRVAEQRDRAPGAQRSPGLTTRMDSSVLLSGSACSISARNSGCQPSILDSTASCAVRSSSEPSGGRIMAQRTSPRRSQSHHEARWSSVEETVSLHGAVCVIAVIDACARQDAAGHAGQSRRPDRAGCVRDSRHHRPVSGVFRSHPFFTGPEYKIKLR